MNGVQALAIRKVKVIAAPRPRRRTPVPEPKISTNGEPMPYAPGFDVEIESNGSWTLYRGAHALATGRHRFTLTRLWAIRRAIRRWRGFSFGDDAGSSGVAVKP